MCNRVGKNFETILKTLIKFVMKLINSEESATIRPKGLSSFPLISS